jgi:hypothetical protein
LGISQLSSIFLCVLPASSDFTDQYSYQDRGDRREAFEPSPSVGDDIALITVRADPVGATVESIPEQIRLSFFLPEDWGRVRELDDQYCYWTDRVHPAKSREPGKTNNFR